MTTNRQLYWTSIFKYRGLCMGSVHAHELKFVKKGEYQNSKIIS